MPRRTLKDRERVIHSMATELIDDYHFQLLLSTQAGTYIKEFVHGDMGRTSPNLCSILNTCVDIVELDVTVRHYVDLRLQYCNTIMLEIVHLRETSRLVIVNHVQVKPV